MIVIEIFAAVEEIVADATDSTEQFLRTTGGIHVVGETVPALLDVVRLRRLGQNRRADVVIPDMRKELSTDRRAISEPIPVDVNAISAHMRKAGHLQRKLEPSENAKELVG
ncbi:hypothetical protein LZK79_31535 (plasmid) [Rhizobium leguminosarum]|uniref:hypothetical protein n=1 Tax=Rhizobium johnstonii TaxID=3019933 RepID=UPI003F9B4DE6|nr:hypothetical protein LZK79_31535 [Rhizobium leguminosarum]